MSLTLISAPPFAHSPPAPLSGEVTPARSEQRTAHFPQELPPVEKKNRATLVSQQVTDGNPAAAATSIRPSEMGGDEQMDRRSVEEAAAKVQRAVTAMSSSSLQFQVDKETEKLVIKVIDNTTKEVIKQIPPQVILEIAKALDKLQGLLVREKA